MTWIDATCSCARSPRLAPLSPSRALMLARAGVGFAACGNTMRSLKITLSDLLPGFVAADKGGVVRIAELQSQGYLYLRP